MGQVSGIDVSAASRDLVRNLRAAFHEEPPEVMPESVVWQTFHELEKRGEPRAKGLFVGALRSLHARRLLNSAEICSEDVYVEEHRLATDPFLGDLWKAYKKCIRTNRTGPASHLLTDIERQLG